MFPAIIQLSAESCCDRVRATQYFRCPAVNGGAEDPVPCRRPGKGKQRHIKAERSPARPHSDQEQREGKHGAVERVQRRADQRGAAAAQRAEQLIEQAEPETGQQRGCRLRDLPLEGQLHVRSVSGTTAPTGSAVVRIPHSEAL